MTTPTDAGAGIPGELIAKSAKNPEKHHADPAYCSGADHSPDAGNFERALNLAARAMQRQFNAGGSEEDIEAVIWQHLRPAFEAKERAEPLPYSISEPEGGWRSHGSFSREEKAKLRPVAETLAMLDGNAFFGNEVSAGAEWYEQYLPEAHALYEGNGGDTGWAGEASFARPGARALSAEAKLAQAVEALDEIARQDVVEIALDPEWPIRIARSASARGEKS